MGVGGLPPLVSAAGETPKWGIADFRLLVTEFLVPRASAQTVLDILTSLGIWTVPMFNQISGDRPTAELEAWVREQLGAIAVGLDSGEVLTRCVVWRNMLGSGLMRNRRGDIPRIPTRVYPECARISYQQLPARAEGPRTCFSSSIDAKVEQTQTAPVCPCEGSPRGPAHFHAPRRRRVDSTDGLFF